MNLRTISDESVVLAMERLSLEDQQFLLDLAKAEHAGMHEIGEALDSALESKGWT